MSKLQTLAEIEGFDNVQEFIEAFALDSVCPGICLNPDCDYSTSVEPDQDQGWCENCGKPSVKSGLRLAGIY